MLVRLLLIAIFGVAVSFPVCAIGQTELPSLIEESEVFSGTHDRMSYSVGYDLAKYLVGDANLDNDQVMQGIRDYLSHAKPRYSAEEMEDGLLAHKRLVIESRRAQEIILAEENKKASAEFLAASAKKPDTIVTASGLQYRVLRAGNGATPNKESKVRVHYHGTFPDGRVFDSSVERDDPVTFSVAKVIPGWTEALLLMKVGDKWEIVIPAELAYGAEGRYPIQPNQALVFEVELLEIVK